MIPFDIPFDNSYARLPPRFFSPQLPEPVAKPASIRVNQALAESLGIAPAWLESPEIPLKALPRPVLAGWLLLLTFVPACSCGNRSAQAMPD